MVMNPETLLGSPPIRVEQNWQERDSILYALGVGSEDLDFVYEDGLKALPMMAVVLGYPGFIWQNPEWNVDWKKVLHGEQSIIIHAPLPAKGHFIGETRITKLIDKGAEKGAIAMVGRQIVGGDGKHYADVIATIFLRGDGGFGGSPDGAPVPHKVPSERGPDLSVDMPTAKNSAMIYRLSGDLNPLHIDPDVARDGGFERPILHGLATYGVVGRALLSALVDNDPSRVRRMDVRFSRPVEPGETIRTDIWIESDGKAAFQSTSIERNVTVLSNGYFEFTA
jgi:acyl dehydratase